MIEDNNIYSYKTTVKNMRITICFYDKDDKMVQCQGQGVKKVLLPSFVALLTREIYVNNK